MTHKTFNNKNIKTMKRALKAILTLSMIVMAMVAFAQPGQHHNKPQMTPEQFATATADKMATTLSLTDAQKKQVYALNLEKAKAREAMKVLTAEQRQAQQSQHAQKMKAYDTKMAKILTPEQYTQWQATQSNMHKGKGDGHKKGKDGAKTCTKGDGANCKSSCKDKQ